MANLNLESAKRLLREFKFTELFTQELGWDNLRLQPRKLSVGDETFTLTPVAEKRGFQIFECASAGEIPLRAVRMKIDREVTKQAFEHLIVFVDGARRTQIWRWEQRDEGKPRVGREERFAPDTGGGERLARKLERLAVSLDEEEQMSLPGVTTRARAAFNVERVTKKFYDRFKKEHEAFLKHIDGIEDAEQRSWYASLMLNRLMFVYFIQHKGFLDGDKNYLQNRLERVQEEHGKDRFYSFYRVFLLKLFHDGLGRQGRTRELEKLLGRVPYLNGGLFDVHQLEAGAMGKAIEIPDKAFARVFKFFDEYDWLLDDRPLRDEREINPDVLGYIFEKYINQKQMGAYYTKEDITEYISKNTIIPFLFDRARKLCANAFDAREGVWRLLREQPDRYIYDAVRKGVIDEQGEVIPLPQEIAAGVKDVSKRGRWNTAAGDEYGLPTETWREHVARRGRCLEVRRKLQRGEVTVINELVTLNLDIRQFAQDVLGTYEGSDLIAAFYRAIAGRIPEKSNEEFEQGLSVLDPTAGSGAFLFAALNVLEPLVETCIERMRSFVEEADRAGRTQAHPAFRRVLAEISKHPNAEYFILKSIIIGNLYGVDIMEEATEICKLRLFLKLVAQLERDNRRENMGLEPLPDIDFNIRAGNTLVGFASLAEVKAALSSKFDYSGGEVIRNFEEDAHEADRAYKRFRQMQTVYDLKDATQQDFKLELRRRLSKLADTLDRSLAEIYGKDPHKPKEFEEWRKRHQPFHWFTEFYGIITSGGFDVIVGNPPYVEYTKVRGEYSIRGYQTENCGNLYAFVMERSLSILKNGGRSGLIVPLAGFSTERMQSLQTYFLKECKSIHAAFLEATTNPTILFVGVKVQLSIIFAEKANSEGCDLFSTAYLRAFHDERPYLFQRLYFCALQLPTRRIPKIQYPIEQPILQKVTSRSTVLGSFFANHPTNEKVYYRRLGNFFFKLAFTKPPLYRINGANVRSSTVEDLYLKGIPKVTVTALINSTLMFWYWNVLSNVMDFKVNDIKMLGFDYDSMSFKNKAKLEELGSLLLQDLEKHRVVGVENRKSGDRIEVARYWPQYSKAIIDNIDRVLADHFGLTEQELDFIINYDIKYRMGRNTEGDGDE
jgi:hypothetical protein